MTVEDWAEREAQRQLGPGDGWKLERACFASGITLLADLLVSDEAVVNAFEVLRERGHDVWAKDMRAALQAALDAVTKEDGNDR